MADRGHHSDYDQDRTIRCERALLTLIGDVGPWSDRIFLAGGLAPRYLVGAIPEDAAPHVGTTDVDLIVGVAIADDGFESYETLHTNLTKSGFDQVEPSFRWTREVDGSTVWVEFICETEAVDRGAIFRPKEGTGSKMAAFNAKGALLATQDFIEVEIEGERLDGGGHSQITLRVVGLLTYTVLKIFAFQDRHENKDSYDLVFTLLNSEVGPEEAGRRAANSEIASHPQVEEAIQLLEERFSTEETDGSVAYAAFLSNGDNDEDARNRQTATGTVSSFLRGYRESK